jgi:hypothetical protein
MPLMGHGTVCMAPSARQQIACIEQTRLPLPNDAATLPHTSYIDGKCPDQTLNL